MDDDEEGDETSSEECDDAPAKVEKPSIADVAAAGATGKPAEVKKTDKSPAAKAAGTDGTSSTDKPTPAPAAKPADKPADKPAPAPAAKPAGDKPCGCGGAAGKPTCPSCEAKKAAAASPES